MLFFTDSLPIYYISTAVLFFFPFFVVFFSSHDDASRVVADGSVGSGCNVTRFPVAFSGVGNPSALAGFPTLPILESIVDLAWVQFYMWEGFL